VIEPALPAAPPETFAAIVGTGILAVVLDAVLRRPPPELTSQLADPAA